MKLTRAAIGLAAVGAGWLVSRTLHLHEGGEASPADELKSDDPRGRKPQHGVPARWTAEELDRAGRHLH
jgi:hypothetical protein